MMLITVGWEQAKGNNRCRQGLKERMPLLLYCCCYCCWGAAVAATRRRAYIYGLINNERRAPSAQCAMPLLSARWSCCCEMLPAFYAAAVAWGGRGRVCQEGRVRRRRRPMGKNKPPRRAALPGCLMMLLLLAPSLQGLCFVGERDKAGRGE